ncbi:alpha-beta hydrolase superfamily lysophospholipase [Paraburkholderia bryophila]|uniref:Alpha-beta hydrolase superfamily lysophospholipase n=2 Tax=Paraburkholderia bryophila TaxID=420952 RepID=A0A329BTH8_9BURK|nr:alpha-beta hydrolase superfamily lysophospholipase [Paraburkholderia bryophila]
MTTDTAIQTQDFMIQSDTPAIELHIRNKRAAGKSGFGEARTVLLMHGATYGSGSLYDTAIGGYSFMDYLACAGFDVYAVDARGYGESTRPQQMNLPSSQSEPIGRTESGIRDFTTAVNFVLRTSGIARLNVIGMSWGGSVTGAFTARNGHKVRKLGLVAPQWISDRPIPLDAGGSLGGYRVVRAADARERWVGAAPEWKRDTLIPEGGFTAWLNNTLRSEPDDELRKNQSIRAVNGPVQDIREFWAAGKPFYDPGQIEVPVLLIHGEWDIDVPLALMQDYFVHLTGSPNKRWLELGEATHMLMLEKNRVQAYDALAGFLSEV